MNFRLLSVSFLLADRSRNGAIAISVSDGKTRKRVMPPEWKSDSEERFPAAFVPPSSRSTPLIQAEFQMDPPDTRTIRIGAHDTTKANILGSIATTDVYFLKGLSGPVSLPVVGHRLGPVGVHKDRWKWFFVDEANEEAFITDSEHDIFSILGTPLQPWDSESSDPWQLPWAEALSTACVWAAGAASASPELLLRIASGLYFLGEMHPPKFRYQQDAQYATGEIITLRPLLKYIAGPGTCDCSNPALCDRLCGGAINCLDCAAIVSTFCNLVGGTSKIARLDPEFGNLHLNAVRLIGHVPGSTASFLQHMLTWRDGVSNTELVFDACIGSGTGSSTGPFAALPFGAPKEPKSYRVQVFDSNTEPGVLGPSDPRTVAIEQTRSALRLLPPVDRSLFGFETWFGTSRPANKGFAVWNLVLPPGAIHGWNLLRYDRLDRKPRPWLLDALWTSAEGEFRTWIFECETREDAHVGLLELIQQEPHGMPERVTDPPAGDIFFRMARKPATSALFARGNLIIRVVKAPGTTTSVEDLASRLDSWLHEQPSAGKLLRSANGYDESAIRLPLQPPDFTDDGRWFKIFVDDAEIKVDERGAFLYRPLPGKYLAKAYRFAGSVVDLEVSAAFSL